MILASNNKLNLGIIGSTNIASYHVAALRAVGFEVNHCAASLNSKSIAEFSVENSINNVWNDPIQLASSEDCWDGLVITCSIDGVLPILKVALEVGKPVLIEKPVSFDLVSLSHLIEKYDSQIMVGFNRRFYSTVQRAREFAQQREYTHAVMTLPERVDQNSKNPFHSIYRNSVHGIDILQFIYGELELLQTFQTGKNSRYFGRQCWLRSKRGDTICVQMPWNSATNFSLNIEDGEERLQLMPFEKYSIFSGFDIISATKDYPIKQFIPHEIESGNVFDRGCGVLKPGFFGQAKEFYNLFQNNSRIYGASLIDAYNALQLAKNICEDIIVKDAK